MTGPTDRANAAGHTSMSPIQGSARTLSDAELRKLTVDQFNAGARCYRPDLRYSRADALRFAELWNESRSSTVASVVSDGAAPVVVIADCPRSRT